MERPLLDGEAHVRVHGQAGVGLRLPRVTHEVEHAHQEIAGDRGAHQWLSSRILSRTSPCIS
jgi:hypothetical protein